MPTEAQRRANRRQDATRARAPVWLTAEDGARLDKLAARIGAPSRVETVRKAMDALEAGLSPPPRAG